MAMRYKMMGVLSVFMLLSACGKGEPSKQEAAAILRSSVYDSLIKRSAMSETLKQQWQAKLEHNLNVRSLKCHDVKGLDKVYDCEVLIVGDAGAKTTQARFIRKDDGSLSMQDVPAASSSQSDAH